MVKNPSVLEPKIICMIPLIWQWVDEWRQWSLFTDQGRWSATLRMLHATGAALIQNLEESWWQSSQTPIRNLSFRLLKTWKVILTVFLDITFIQLSWFFATSIDPLSVSSNQEMQIWYGQDWKDTSEGNNSGKVCADVYAWYVWIFSYREYLFVDFKSLKVQCQITKQEPD